MSDKMREALEQSAQGWENVIELGLLPPQHVGTAAALRDKARAALAEQPAQGEAVAPADVQRVIDRLMSSDPDFDDCEDAANMLRRLASAPPAPAVPDDVAEYLLNLCRARPGMGNKEIIAEMREVFAAPPAPSVSVPDEMWAGPPHTVDYVNGWNACRDALLAAAPEVPRG